MANLRFNGTSWRHWIALGVSSAMVLAGLIALRGPDAIGLGLARAVGEWRLTDFALWHLQAPFGALGGIPYSLWGLEMRGWQITHVLVAWVTAACWLWTVPSKSWRGLTPLAPALLAVALSDVQSGLAAFGLSVFILSAWRAIHGKDPEAAWFTLPLAAWLAAWFSPGSLPIAVALVLETSSRVSLKRTVATLILMLVTVNFTPYGTTIWPEAWVFFAWSPQPMMDATGVIALCANLLVLIMALRACFPRGPRGPSVAAALLFCAAWRGQTGYLWPAGLMMIPVWSYAEDKARTTGFNIRWWFRLSVIIASVVLLYFPGMAALPRWYDLAMSASMVRPTLTRDALPKSGLIYLNPAGRPLARFGGPLMQRVVEETSRQRPREPSLWREQDRQKRYQAVWLLGEPAGYAPLARHLGESPDWRLAAVDAVGMLFVREPRGDAFATEPALQFAREQGAAASRANFMAACAVSCLAANAIPEADEVSRLAVRQSHDSTRAAIVRARALMLSGDVQAALEESDRAIQLQSRSSEAWQVRAEVLLHAGRVDEAGAAAQRGRRLAPDDTGALWLAARASNASRAFGEEAEILEKLIALTQGRGGDAGFYLFYLGQAYAKAGLARPALNALSEAAAAPGLSEGQRREIEEVKASIRAAPNF